MTEGSEEKQFQLWKELNNRILDEMSTGKLSQIPKDEIMEYFKAIHETWKGMPKRYLYAHSTLRKSIGSYFALLDWTYGFEIPCGDMDSFYKFDFMAQKGNNTIIVDVRPELTTGDLGQRIDYLFEMQKKFKEARVFLGTDLLNLGVVFGRGETTDIIIDNAQRNGLGVILANKEIVFPIPAEFLVA